MVAMKKTFDGAVSCNFGNDFARNSYFDIDNSSSYHTNNRKNNFLVSREIPTYGVNESFGSPEKTFSTNVSK